MFKYFRFPAIAMALLIAACGPIDFDDLIAAILYGGVPPGTKSCSQQMYFLGGVSNTPGALNYMPLATRPLVVPAYDYIANNIDIAFDALPPLRDDPVFRAVREHAKFAALNSIYLVQRHGIDRALSPPERPRPVSLGPVEFYNFAKQAEEIMRGDGGSNIDPTIQARLVDYFSTYGTGKFVSYFGVPFNQPQLALSIPDTEINQAASVIFELVFDLAFQTPVWLGDDKNYYPGGTTNAPTVVAHKYQTAVPILTSPSTGCGMNVAKAKTINYVAQKFSSAATTEVGLMVKSLGGLSFGAGILGKVSIGDNTALSSLIEAIVAEVVDRVIAQAAYPILTGLDYGQSPPPQVAYRGTNSRVANIQALSRTFGSSKQLRGD